MSPNHYSNGSLDRLDQHRADSAWFRRRLDDPGSRVLPMWRDRHLVTSNQEIAWFSYQQLQPLLDEQDPLILLGRDTSGRYWFSVDLSRLEDPLEFAPLHPAMSFRDLRAIGPLLPADSASMLAYARALCHWHRQHRFCGRCGSPTRVRFSGHQRACSDPVCGRVHYPRTDPAVIMLVHHGDHILLGRQATWPEGMHSILAGYLEPGESLEDAVRREVQEEVGIGLNEIRYHSSQPWPFPASVMLGFQASAELQPLRVNTSELQSARWYQRDELLRQPPDSAFHLPRQDSIARRLIEEWLASTGDRE